MTQGVSVPDNLRAQAFESVTKMESHLAVISSLARAIDMLAELVPERGDVFMVLSEFIERCQQEVEEERGALFRLLHPNREYFERVGWPHQGAPGASP